MFRIALTLAATALAAVVAPAAAGTGPNGPHDRPPVPTLSVGDTEIVEGNGGQSRVDLTITLSGPSELPVTVDYASQDGSAKTGEDYQATSGTLLFAAGQTSRIVSHFVHGDAEVEGDESFSLRLANPHNSTIADGDGTVTIKDDDTAGGASGGGNDGGGAQEPGNDTKPGEDADQAPCVCDKLDVKVEKALAPAPPGGPQPPPDGFLRKDGTRHWRFEVEWRLFCKGVEGRCEGEISIGNYQGPKGGGIAPLGDAQVDLIKCKGDCDAEKGTPARRPFEVVTKGTGPFVVTFDVVVKCNGKTWTITPKLPFTKTGKLDLPNADLNGEDVPGPKPKTDDGKKPGDAANPAKCECADVSVKTESIMLAATDQPPPFWSLGIRVGWQLKCSGGAGDCAGEIQLVPPAGGSFEVRTPNGGKISCRGNCKAGGKKGATLIIVRSDAERAGKTYTFRLLRYCLKDGKRRLVGVTEVTVVFGAGGGVTSTKTSTRDCCDGKPPEKTQVYSRGNNDDDQLKRQYDATGKRRYQYETARIVVSYSLNPARCFCVDNECTGEIDLAVGARFEMKSRLNGDPPDTYALLDGTSAGGTTTQGGSAPPGPDVETQPGGQVTYPGLRDENRIRRLKPELYGATAKAHVPCSSGRYVRRFYLVKPAAAGKTRPSASTFYIDAVVKVGGAKCVLTLGLEGYYLEYGAGYPWLPGTEPELPEVDDGSGTTRNIAKLIEEDGKKVDDPFPRRAF